MKKVVLQTGANSDILNVILKGTDMKTERDEWGYIELDIPETTEGGFVKGFFKAMNIFRENNQYVTALSLMVEDDLYNNWQHIHIGPITPAKYLTWVSIR